MSIHLLPDARPPYAPLLAPIFTPKTIPHALAVILLDWNEPWYWLGQLRERISILKSVLDSLDNDCKDTMDVVMRSWRERRTGPAVEGMTTTFMSDRNQQTPAPPPPLGQGEWDDPIGMPICIVCLNAEKTHILAREHVWTDTQFDYILQHLRTILLKHGGSLIYTSSTQASNAVLTDLIRSSLSIQSLLKKTILKAEAIQRDSIIIPPNWDTAGKIKTLDSTFDVETIGRDWEAEIVAAVQNVSSQVLAEQLTGTASAPTDLLLNFSHKIQDPDHRFASASSVTTTNDQSTKPRPNLQAFLAAQLPVLRRLEAEDAQEISSQSHPDASTTQDSHTISRREPQLPLRAAGGNGAATADATEIATPVLMNVGGVNVDVEAAVKQLRERAARDANNKLSEQQQAERANHDAGEVEDAQEGEKRLEWLAGLANRRRTGGSTPSTPQR